MKRNYTRNEIVDVLVRNAIARGITPTELRALLMAETAHGMLRDDVPAWLTQSTMWIGEHGRLYNPDVVERATVDWVRVVS